MIGPCPRRSARIYVRPNELTLERPFIERHIAATRAAYSLDHRSTEKEFTAHADGHIDFAKNRTMLDNVRLWDWRAFHDTLGQKQPLRPFTYADTDVDRYHIDGRLRQMLLAPRELDPAALGDSWINRKLLFTHGYGLVLAEANRITADGNPVLLIKDAPVEVLTSSLKLTRPQIYYGETLESPVFVHTSQEEFDYPSGSKEVNVHYDGAGGFPINAFGMRTIAAISEGDSNIFLNNSLTPDSRMMIRRRVPERLHELAEFVTWDTDPYMVITESGKLVWIVDGYLTSEAHPYSRTISLENGLRFNYIRNSVKATVDAYDGSVKMYVFDEDDPLVNAYRRLFPDLFSPASEMPADVRAHTRSPEMLFRTQAEIFRTYHMREPESFYNRADQWDLATYSSGQTAGLSPVPATYLIATLPGETEPEFLLTIPFTPRGKTEPDRSDGGALRRSASGRNRGAGFAEAGDYSGSGADRDADQSGSEYFEGSDAMEPAGLAGTAEPDADAADRQYVPVRRADLYSIDEREDAAVEEGRAGGGKYAGVRRYLRSGAGAVGGDSGRTDDSGGACDFADDDVDSNYGDARHGDDKHLFRSQAGRGSCAFQALSRSGCAGEI